MKRLGLVSFLTVTLASSIAFADDSDDDAIAPLPPPTESTTPIATTPATATIDAVHLRNGGLYRGRVTEIVPGDHVTVLVAPSSEVKRIAWPEVDRVIVASTAIPPVPTAAASVPTAPAPTEAPMVGPRARVHITSSKPVILYRRAAGSSAFVEACTSPCDRELPIGDTYRLAGSGLSENRELILQSGPGGAVDVVVDRPSIPGMLLGGFAAGIGGTVSYFALLVALGTAGHDSDTSEAALVTSLVSGAVAVSGVFIFLRSAKTDVTQRSGGSTGDAFLRTPSWRNVGSSATDGGVHTPAASFPLVFAGRF